MQIAHTSLEIVSLYDGDLRAESSLLLLNALLAGLSAALARFQLLPIPSGVRATLRHGTQHDQHEL